MQSRRVGCRSRDRSSRENFSFCPCQGCQQQALIGFHNCLGISSYRLTQRLGPLSTSISIISIHHDMKNPSRSSSDHSCGALSCTGPTSHSPPVRWHHVFYLFMSWRLVDTRTVLHNLDTNNYGPGRQWLTFSLVD